MKINIYCKDAAPVKVEVEYFTDTPEPWYACTLETFNEDHSGSRHYDSTGLTLDEALCRVSAKVTVYYRKLLKTNQ